MREPSWRVEASKSRENEGLRCLDSSVWSRSQRRSVQSQNQPDVTRPQGNDAALTASDDDRHYGPRSQPLLTYIVPLGSCCSLVVSACVVAASGAPGPARCIWAGWSWHGTAGGSGSTTMHRGPRQQNRPGGSERYTRGSRSSAEASGVRNNDEDQGSMSCSCSSVWSRSQRAWGCR